MSKVGHLIIHGTSQDIMSGNETTVQLAKALQQAGELVVEIGGPGSVERAARLTAEVYPDYVPIDEIDPGLPYLNALLGGVTLGTGIEGIVADCLAAIATMLRAGVTEIKIIGFSRGAVAAALLCQRLKLKQLVPVSLCMLDPVPGPFRVPKSVEIPSFVSKLILIVSRHEGRPGFTGLELRLANPSTKVFIDTFAGVHGDIGGSKQSAIGLLVKDDVIRELALPLTRLTLPEWYAAYVEAVAQSPVLINPGFANYFSVRGLRTPGGADYEQELELPSHHSTEAFSRDSLVLRYLLNGALSHPRPRVPNTTSTDKLFFEKVIAPLSQAANTQADTRLRINVPTQSAVFRGIVRHAPPRSVNFLASAFVSFVKKLPK